MNPWLMPIIAFGTVTFAILDGSVLVQLGVGICDCDSDDDDDED